LNERFRDLRQGGPGKGPDGVYDERRHQSTTEGLEQLEGGGILGTACEHGNATAEFHVYVEAGEGLAGGLAGVQGKVQEQVETDKLSLVRVKIGQEIVIVHDRFRHQIGVRLVADRPGIG
jgi:hypothetical protein